MKEMEHTLWFITSVYAAPFSEPFGEEEERVPGVEPSHLLSILSLFFPHQRGMNEI